MAGIEAEKTNELLQALALVLENKHNSSDQAKTNNSESKNNSTLHISTKPSKSGKSIWGAIIYDNKYKIFCTVTKKPTLPGNMSKGNSVPRVTTKSNAVNKQAASSKTKDIAKIGANKSNQVSSSKPSLAGMPNKKTNKLEESKKDSGASSMKPDVANKQTKSVPTVSLKSNHSSRIPKDATATPRSIGLLESFQQNQTAIDDEDIADTIMPVDYANNDDDEPVKDTSGLPVNGCDKSQVPPDVHSIDSEITIDQTTDNLNVMLYCMHKKISCSYFKKFLVHQQDSTSKTCSHSRSSG